eukprot:3159137-Pyramimonas_sp.AAC.1
MTWEQRWLLHASWLELGIRCDSFPPPPPAAVAAVSSDGRRPRAAPSVWAQALRKGPAPCRMTQTLHRTSARIRAPDGTEVGRVVLQGEYSKAVTR